MSMAQPRAEDVRAILMLILARADFPGRDALARQVGTVEVAGQVAGMTRLSTSDGCPTSSAGDGPLPVDVLVLDDAGVACGELLVWVESGRLSDLEFAWWTDVSPSALPALDHLDCR